jgi:hypothetical protein
MEAVLHGSNNTVGVGGGGAAGWRQRCIVGGGVAILLAVLHGGGASLDGGTGGGDMHGGAAGLRTFWHFCEIERKSDSCPPPLAHPDRLLIHLSRPIRVLSVGFDTDQIKFF